MELKASFQLFKKKKKFQELQFKWKLKYNSKKKNPLLLVL